MENLFRGSSGYRVSSSKNSQPLSSAPSLENTTSLPASFSATIHSRPMNRTMKNSLVAQLGRLYRLLLSLRSLSFILITDIRYVFVFVIRVFHVDTEIGVDDLAVLAASRNDTAGLINSSGFDMDNSHLLFAVRARNCFEFVIRHFLSLINRRRSMIPR